MIKRDLEITNELGIHARVASRIVREAKRFECSVTARKGGDAHDLKNVSGVITVNAKKGAILAVEFDGRDEQEASEAFAALFANKFGER
jgi:phosphocarrier protein